MSDHLLVPSAIVVCLLGVSLGFLFVLDYLAQRRMKRELQQRVADLSTGFAKSPALKAARKLPPAPPTPDWLTPDHDGSRDDIETRSGYGGRY